MQTDLCILLVEEAVARQVAKVTECTPQHVRHGYFLVLDRTTRYQWD